ARAVDAAGDEAADAGGAEREEAIPDALVGRGQPPELAAVRVAVDHGPSGAPAAGQGRARPKPVGSRAASLHLRPRPGGGRSGVVRSAVGPEVGASWASLVARTT